MLYKNQYGMPDAFVRVIDSLTHDLSESDPMRIGVTTLINPPRIRVLTVRHWNEKKIKCDCCNGTGEINE